MPRIRSLKPSFWSDESVADLSRDARLLLVGLISAADDDGRFLASAAAITGYIYPHDDIQPAKIKKWLDEIAAAGIIQLYAVGRREYGHFPKYRDHQRISKPQPSTLPPPSNGTSPQGGAE